MAEDHKLYVIEDAAQSFGSEYQGRKCGTLGIVAAMSFYPTKNLGALGDAGLVTTDDPAIDKKLRNAIIDFADDSRHASPWAAKIYTDAITRGKRHPHAVRILARAWIRVIWRCWQDHTPYNPQLHGGAKQLTAA